MHYQDYYKIPAVSRDATAEEIKKSFRKLARKYHPDVPHEKDAEGRMKEINEAYAVLSDPESLPPMTALAKATNSYMAGVRVNLAK